MLIYEPGFDPYHSAVRILAIKEAASDTGAEISIDGARIADYFLVNPSALNTFRFPNEHRSMRKLIREADNPYKAITGKSAFERMRPIFYAALSSLGASGL